MTVRLLVDADACPVTRLAERIAAQAGIPSVLLCDMNHLLQSEISEVVTVSPGRDAVDIALINLCRAGDVVITQDYGVAAMALGRGAYVLHQSGMEYTHQNIDGLLMQRHLAGKARRSSGKHHLRGPAKRTPQDDRRFEEALRQLLTRILSQASGLQ